jgi:predicted DNA-binding antitoxin AbrB/MazE fold protein
MVVKAVYAAGVFKPIMTVNLADGEWVELKITRSPQRRRKRKVVSLQGIWKEHLRPEDQGDWVSDTIAEIRRESGEKLDRLARELSENMAHEQ